MITEYFLENLRILIDERGLNQLRLSREINIPQPTINNWFNRKNLPSTETIESLANFFNIDPYYFFMKPGTQQAAPTPANRDDKFKTFIDRLAKDNLSETDLQAYYEQGGVDQFVTQLVNNYETTFLGFQDWYQILIKELAKYVNLDLVEKVRRDLNKNQSPTKKSSETA